MIQTALLLADKNNRFLFEILPDYFPQGRFTATERGLWARYFEEKEKSR
jgi:hypothetical protein